MKRFVGLTLMLFLMFNVNVIAHAEVATQNYALAQEIVDDANEKIDSKIDKAIEQSDIIIDSCEEGKITEAQKDKKIDDIIDNLLEKTDAISAKAIKECSKLSVEVQCEYIEVTIDGQTVMVDPLIIVGG